MIGFNVVQTRFTTNLTIHKSNKTTIRSFRNTFTKILQLEKWSHTQKNFLYIASAMHRKSIELF